MVTYVVRKPPEAVTIALAHHNRAHEQFNRTNILERDRALACRLEQAERLTQLLFRNGARSINLVTKDQERYLAQLLNRKKRVKLCTGLGEALYVL